MRINIIHISSLSIMYSKLYFPRFFTAGSEKSINEKLSASDTLKWEKTKYQALLQLRKHGSRIITSLCELKAITSKKETDSLYGYVEFVMQKAISNPNFNSALYANELGNRFALLKAKIEEHKKLEQCCSGMNLFENSIITAVGALGVVFFGVAVSTGPLGMALLAVGMAIASALLTTIAAYSVYVDSRFIKGKQLNEIEVGINFISSYPNGSLFDEVDEHSLCCP